MDIEASALINRSFKNATIYQPIEEAIVNSIHAIQERGNLDKGVITVKFLRLPKYIGEDSNQVKSAHIIGVEIEDNGIGFTDENRDSFKTVFSKYKNKIGGIGFGRISYLKFFDNVRIESFYEKDGQSYERSWRFIADDNIFSKLKETKNQGEKKHGTKIVFKEIINGSFDVDFEVIVRRLVERLLAFYVFDQKLPKINFIDDDGNKTIEFEKFIRSTQKIQVLKTKSEEISIKNKKFSVKMAKIYQSANNNAINLCAHNRPVVKISMKEIMPLLGEDFFDKKDERFIIQVYISSNFLDSKVNEERNDFVDIPKKDNGEESVFPQNNISFELLNLNIKDFIVRELQNEYTTRKEKRDKDINKFFNENRYYDDIKNEIDYEKFGQNVEPIELEKAISELIFKKKQKLHQKINSFTQSTHPKISEEELEKIMKEIGTTQKADLAKYVVGRKLVLDLMEKTLEYDDQGKFAKEETLHEIIFPRYKDNTTSKYNDNALWILDEKLNFEKYICSEKHLKTDDKDGKDRIDIGVFGESVAFRGENKKATPITVFEFKRPGKTSFINPSEKEDPIEQITRYLNGLRDGKYRMESGMEIDATENTPAYGYVICTIDASVEKWLRREKGCKYLPDGEGFIYFNTEANIIIYIISWKKLIQDARERNKILFKRLGIE